MRHRCDRPVAAADPDDHPGAEGVAQRSALGDRLEHVGQRRLRRAACPELTRRPCARSGTPRAPTSLGHPCSRGPRQPIHRQLNRVCCNASWPTSAGSPVFQSTTVVPPSGSANTASMRPRTTVSPRVMSNGTSTSTGVRAAHGDAANAACSSARRSGVGRPARRRRHRAGRRGRRAARRRRSAAPSRETPVPSKACGSGRSGSRRCSRVDAADGVASDVHKALTDSCGGKATGGAWSRRSRSASNASTSAASRRDRHHVVGRRLPCAAARTSTAPRSTSERRAPNGSAGQDASITLSRNGFGSPSGGAGAQCSMMPHGLAPAADASMTSLISIRNSDGPRRLGLGGAPLVAGQQQRVFRAGQRHIEQPAFLVDLPLLEVAIVLGRWLVGQLLSIVHVGAVEHGHAVFRHRRAVSAQQRRQIAGVGQPGAASTPWTGRPARSGAAPRRPPTPAPWRRAR